MTSPELPPYLDYSQFGMIRGPSPLPDTVDICEVGTFEHPDGDYTTYQIKVLLVFKYFCILVISHIMGHVFKFYMELHNSNRGLPIKILFYESLLLLPIFYCTVVMPGYCVAVVFQGAYFIGEPFSYFREYFFLAFGEVIPMVVYSWPMYIICQYLQLKGRASLPWWALTPTVIYATWSVCFNIYLLYVVISILLGSLPPINMMYMWVIYRKYSARMHAVTLTIYSAGFFLLRFQSRKNPAGYQVVRAYWPAVVYACVNIFLQFSPNFFTAIDNLENNYPDPWLCFVQNDWNIMRAPIVIGGVKYANSTGRSFMADDVFALVIMILGCLSLYFFGPKSMREKLLIANWIKPLSKWFIFFFQILLILWAVVPFHLPQRKDFETYFRTLMIIVWVVTAFLYLIRREDATFRSDWATAGLVRFEERKVSEGATQAQIQFYLPVFVSIFSNAVFVTSLITSPLTPWKEESGLQSGDVLGRFDFDSGFLPKASVTSMYFTVVIVYIIDHYINILSVMVPPVSASSKLLPLVEKYQGFRYAMRFILFTVGSLPALRLIISGTKCERIEGLAMPVLAISKDVYCNYYGYHLAAILIGFFIATWFVGFNNLRFASNVEQTKRPFFARYPSSLMIENASALLLVAIRSFEPDGTTLASIGLVVLTLNLVFYLTQWTFLQNPVLIYGRCCVFALVIVFYLCALFAQAGPNQWWPIILLIVSLPFAIGGTYFIARKKFSNNERLVTIQDRSLMIIRTLCIKEADDDEEEKDLSINLSDLSDSDMGVALCTDRLQMLLSIVLKRGIQDSWDNKDQLNLIKDIERGYMTTLGLKSTDFDARIILLLAPYLLPNVPSQFRDPAIRILHRVHERNLSVIKSELFFEIIKLFCFVDDAELHDLLADVLTTAVGNDKILVYNSDENNKSTFHQWALTKDVDAVFEYQIPGRKLYLLPYHLLNRFTFEPRYDLVNMSLSFPPQLMWDTDQFNTFNQAASLFIPQDAGVIKMDTIKRSALETDRPPVTRGKIHPITYPKWRWVLFTLDQIEDLEFDLKFSSEIYRFLSGVIPRYTGQETGPATNKEISPEEQKDTTNSIQLESK